MVGRSANAEMRDGRGRGVEKGASELMRSGRYGGRESRREGGEGGRVIDLQRAAWRYRRVD